MGTDIDAPRALIVSVVEQRGLNLAHLSRSIGKAHSYLQQYLRRGIPRTLPEDVRERLACVLGVSPEALRGAVPGKGAPREAAADAVALTPDEVSALRAFRTLSPAAKKRALLILPTLD
jgi:lambda repressor-like predicted transcriptional regulator